MTDVPRHCGPGVPAACGCLWEAGTWYPCVTHACPHSQHVTPAPGCDLCDSTLGDCADDTYEPSQEEAP